jgi:hypothetical protein
MLSEFFWSIFCCDVQFLVEMRKILEFALTCISYFAPGKEGAKRKNNGRGANARGTAEACYYNYRPPWSEGMSFYFSYGQRPAVEIRSSYN